MTTGLLDSLASSGAVRVLGLSLVHFVWQGALFGLAAAMALRLLRAATPVVRYAVACAALALLASMPPATALVLAVDAPAESGPDVPAPPPVERVRYPGTETSDVTPSDGSVEGRSFDPSLQGRLIGAFSALEDRALPLIVAGWLLGLLFFGGRHLGGWVHLRRTLLRETRPLPDAWERAFQRFRVRLGVGRRVRGALCRGIDTPMVVGCIRPMVLLPVAVLSSLPPDEVEALIAHELAHVTRMDAAVNLLQVAAETLLFFHPVVWWLSRRIRTEREMCCDDLAAAACGSRTLCARALARLSGAMERPQGPALAASTGSLPDRIRHLVRPGRRSGTGVGLVAAAVLLLSTAVGAQLVVDGRPGGRVGASPSPDRTTVPRGGSSRAGSEAPGPTGDGRVIRPPAGLATLDARWEWAMGEIRRRGGGAIGWGVGEVAGGGIVVSNSPGGPPADGGQPLRSRLDEDLDAPLPRAALVLGVPGPGVNLAWVRLRGIEQRIDPGDGPLYWLGTAEASESLAQVDGLLSRSDDPGVRKELAAALSLHAAGRSVLPAVRRVLRSDPDDRVRAEAAAWLDRQTDPGVTAYLHALADRDPSPLVRDEAVTALANLKSEEALRAVRTLARNADDPVVREDAVQSLEDHPDAERLPVLERVIFSDPDPFVREAAVEVLADLEGGGSENLLQRIASSHPYSALREAARDELADRGSLR